MTNQKYAIPICVVLLAASIAVNAYFRLNNFFLRDIDRAARQWVYADLQSALDQQISADYPQRPTEPAVQRIKKSAFDAYAQSNSAKIEQAIRNKSQEMKDYLRDKDGWPYLLETDAYRWARRAQTYLDTGRFGTSIRQNREYDDLEFAPRGDAVESIRLHFYISVYLYKAMHFLNDKLSLIGALGLAPVVLSPVLIVSFFYLCGLFGLSCMGSFIASIFFGLAPIVMARSGYGWFDTDIYNLCMPLLTTAVLAHAFKEKGRPRFLLLALAGILIGIYSSLWSSWWLWFYILCAGFLFYKLGVVSYDKKEPLVARITHALWEVGLFLAVSLVSVWAISGRAVLHRAVQEPFVYLALRQGLSLDNFWPYPLFTVAELKRASVIDMLATSGGSVVLYGGIVGILFLTHYQRIFHDFRQRQCIFSVVFVWLLASLALSHFGHRFLLFLAAPLVLSLCACLDIVYARLCQGRRAYRMALGLAFLALTAIPVSRAYTMHYHASINDTWEKMFLHMRQETPADSIINAYWWEGDWIMTLGRRATIEDPHWQSHAVPYWFSRALFARSEEEAQGILRMIDLAGNKAFEELCRAMGNDKLKTLELLNRLVACKKEEGMGLLARYVQDKDRRDQIAGFLYASPRNAYLMLNNDMIGYLWALSWMANRDFSLGALWQEFSRLRRQKAPFLQYAQQNFGYSVKDAETLYRRFLFTDTSEAAGLLTTSVYRFYTNYAQQPVPQDNRKIILFDNGIVVDREKTAAYFRDETTGSWITAGKVIWATEKTLKETINSQGNADYAVLFFQEADNYKATLCTAPLTETLFFKLYFLQGRGLKYFQLDARQQEPGHTTIYLYKINWGNSTQEQRK
ncbi:MAG TPA: STT3 domain-containing protein [Patescibacteria group bacterium]|nr:STT3 domain-containing protein [Patescibacteria group bacterium]